MKRRRKAATVMRLADYFEYRDIRDTLEAFEITVDRVKLRRLYENGLTMDIASQWMADESLKYEAYKGTLVAFNTLIKYANQNSNKQRKTLCS